MMLYILASCAEKEFWSDHEKKGRWSYGIKSTILWERFIGNANYIQPLNGTVVPVSLPVPKAAQQTGNGRKTEEEDIVTR